MHLWRPHRIILDAASPKNHSFVSTTCFAKISVPPRRCKRNVCKGRNRRSTDSGESQSDCVWPRWRLEDHLAKFYEKICRASSAIVSPTAETGGGNLHKELKLRIRPGKYCKVLATRDGGERRPCFITRFLETLRYDQFNGQPAEKQTCGSHSSRGFVVGGSSIKRFFWIRHRCVEEDHRAIQSTVIHSAGRRSMWSCIRHKNIETWHRP